MLHQHPLQEHQPMPLGLALLAVDAKSFSIACSISLIVVLWLVANRIDRLNLLKVLLVLEDSIKKVDRSSNYCQRE